MNKTIQLEITGYFSSDVNDLENWCPANDDDIFFPLEIYIGERGSVKSDLFTILICSPASLKKHNVHLRPGRHMLIVIRYDWKEIRQKIKDLVFSCQATSWNQATIFLGRYFRWEYEDYSES